MKRFPLFLIIAVLAVVLAASFAWASPFPDDIPLRLDDLTIVAPESDAPGKDFSGIFVGQWKDRYEEVKLNHVLAVEEVSKGEHGIKAVYAFGDAPGWKIKSGKFRIRGTLKAPNQLELVFKDGTLVTYTMQTDGVKLDGVYLHKGKRTLGTFRKISLNGGE